MRTARWHWHPSVDKDLRLGERAADRVAAAVGSWPFVIVQTLLLVAWIVVNGRVLPKLFGGTVFAELPVWDKYPFILLNLMLSFQAAYTGPIVMISQNRQDQKRAQLARTDFETDRDAAERIARVEEKVDRALELLTKSTRDA